MSKKIEKKVKDLSVESAQKILDKEEKKKVAQCQRDVAAALDKHQCRLSGFMIVTEQGNKLRYQITPKPPTA